MFKEVIFSIFSVIIVSNCQQCSIPNDDFRLDCFPETDASQNECLSRGCCWAPPNRRAKNEATVSVPYCYYPADYQNYQIKSLNPTNRGIKATLFKQKPGFLPNEILNLNFEVIYETNTRVRIRITDATRQRYEVPIELGSPDPLPPTNPDYKVIIPSNGSFSFEVKRKSDGYSLFKTVGPLLYSDQFIQISSLMVTNQVYGMGEQNRPFLHNLTDEWTRIGLWARDNAIDINNNLYGTHPFYMAIPNTGKGYGVYYFNSNAQEFVLQPAQIITYRTTGGILDIFIFTGGTPETAVQQYTELIGRPMLPPFWSLGFHLCRWGYTNVSQVSNTLLRNINVDIPVDVQWSDIDYMDAYKDFTTDPVNYKSLGPFIKQIRQKYGIRYVVIIDPGIKIEDPGMYAPYDDGLQMNVYIIDSVTRKPLVGKVWPGETVYPDFTHPNITRYWSKQITNFLNSNPVDGLWIDMNEPSNFYEGSKSGCPGNSPYDKPFFTPLIRDNSLTAKTICPSALHYNDVAHYNLHNLYGYTEAVATNAALVNSNPNKRVFILSRSTFSGSGKYTFHWTGDNTANWDQMTNSIRQILNFNMFGIPMTGADICGFNGDSEEELCVRWMQLGSFYPFMRNHNTLGAKDQDPASWSKSAQEAMKKTLAIRYMLLPHFYTLLVKSHLYGGTVMRPLSFEFYSDPVTHSIDMQFMIGSSILINPVLKQGATNVVAYFPAGVWYDFVDFSCIFSDSNGRWISLNAPLNKINIAIRGGSIIPLLQPSVNTDSLRKNSCILVCGLSTQYNASGDWYWDDGESLDSYTGHKYSYITFSGNGTGLIVKPVTVGYASVPALSNVVIIGLYQTSISRVIVNNKSVGFGFIAKGGILNIVTDNVPMVSTIVITWE